MLPCSWPFASNSNCPESREMRAQNFQLTAHFYYILYIKKDISTCQVSPSVTIPLITTAYSALYIWIFLMLLQLDPSSSMFLGTWLCAILIGTLPVTANPHTRDTGDAVKIAARVDDLLSRMTFSEKLAQTRNIGGILGTNATYDQTTVDGFNNGLGAGSICKFYMNLIFTQRLILSSSIWKLPKSCCSRCKCPERCHRPSPEEESP